jgi:hypothetical protein
VPATDTPTSTATIQVGHQETDTPTATATTEVVETATATATSDETGGENETPGTSPTPGDPTATATQAVTDLPGTGMFPRGGDDSGLLGAILIGIALAGTGLFLRRKTMQSSR